MDDTMDPSWEPLKDDPEKKPEMKTEAPEDENAKKVALAEHLKVDPGEIEQSKYDENTFEHGKEEYLVLTDDEADQKAEEKIKEDLWAFRPEFVAGYAKVDLNPKQHQALVAALGMVQEKLSEDATPIMLAIIDDIDGFVSDAVSADGRGHFLSSYDGEEVEAGQYFIYRQN